MEKPLTASGAPLPLLPGSLPLLLPLPLLPPGSLLLLHMMASTSATAVQAALMASS